MPPVLEFKNITKVFPGVIANDKICFSLEKGEILALLGENGAGKTTLMNVLYSLYQPDEGEIIIEGEKVTFNSPCDAIDKGIGMVHQHFMLVPVFNVAENVMLGQEEVMRGGFLDIESAAKKILAISEEYKLEVNPYDLIKDLPVGVQQRVEIIKLLYRGAEVLIFDEPTAVLTPQEADDLFVIIRSLAQQGKSIIFITHKLREVLDLADRIIVLRQGKVVGETTPAEASKSSLAAMMVGREVILEIDKSPANVGEKVLSVEDLIVTDNKKQVTVDEVSFDVNSGEILGIAGVQGNGQTELVEALTGLRSLSKGRITIKGVEVSHSTPRRITELGVAHIPEDRQRDGLVLPFPVLENLILCTYYLPPFAKNQFIDWKIATTHGQDLKEQFDIRTPSVTTAVGSLSGGNQQKVIVARELSRPISLLVASQPTRGLDVGSIEYIHNQILNKRDEGIAVLLVSPELDEIMQLSDRIAVMYRGKILAIIPAGKASKEDVGLIMAGIIPDFLSEYAVQIDQEEGTP
ncbi:ABC transporter ATP-binding protein [Chloroflexota bacterium]